MSGSAEESRVSALVAHAAELDMSSAALRSALEAHEPEIRTLPNGEGRYECRFEGDVVEALTSLAQQHLFHGTGLERVRRLEEGVEILGRAEFGLRLRIAISRSGEQTRLSVHQTTEGLGSLGTGLILGGLFGGLLLMMSPALVLVIALLFVIFGWRSDRQFRRRVKSLLLDLRVGLYEQQRACQPS